MISGFIRKFRPELTNWNRPLTPTRHLPEFYRTHDLRAVSGTARQSPVVCWLP